MLHVSLCVYCISRLRFSDIGGMAEVDEQRMCIKFCVRLGKTGSETFEMLKQAFGDSCMSRSRTFECFGCIRLKLCNLYIVALNKNGMPYRKTAWQNKRCGCVQATVSRQRSYPSEQWYLQTAPYSPTFLVNTDIWCANQ